MKILKMLGLAAVAAVALMSFAGASTASAEMLTGHQDPPSMELATEFFFLSFFTLGATALGIGKSRQYSPSRLITHCRATAITANTGVASTVTSDSSLRGAAFTARRFTSASDDDACEPVAQSTVQLANSRKDRYAPPIVSALAC